MSSQSVPIPKTPSEAFSIEALKHIADAIAEVEKQTSAEIRISIIEERESSDAASTIQEITKNEFFRLGMDKTRDRNGILLLFLFDERKFYIHGDEGIHRRVDADTWEDVAETMKEEFSHGHFETGVINGLRKITGHLRKAIPADEVNPNELPNEVIFR